MKTRFEKAVMKLYTAFHEGTLDSGDCAHCAVGNIVGNKTWSNVIGYSHLPDSISEKYFKRLINRQMHKNKNAFDVGLQEIEKTGYTPYELMKLESIFMDVVVDNKIETQFKGLCEVVKYLAELDGVENPMEIMHLFKNKELVL